MIYYYVKTIDDPGFECKKFVFVTNEKGVLTEQILRDPELFTGLKSILINPRIIWYQEEGIPLIIFDNVTDTSMVTDLSRTMALVNMAYQKFGGINDTIKQRIVADAAAKLSSEIAEYAYMVSLAQYQAERTGTLDFPINIGSDLIDQEDFNVVTMKKLEAHNDAFKSVFKSITDLENVTLHQNECTDQLFIKIPDRSQLLDDDNSLSSLIPRRSVVCSPYSDKNAYSRHYKELVPKHLYPAIEGLQENNHLDIQPNEEKYYNALLEWIHANVISEFGQDDGTIIDSLSKLYLTELIDNVYSWHWAHNPNVPSAFIDDSDDDDVDSDDTAGNSSDSVDSRYAFERESTDEKFSYNNAVVSLNSFLEEAATKLGYKVYAEALVKVARWGTRKPIALVLSGYSLSFDLATNKVFSSLNIADYKLKKINGARYQFSGWITPSIETSDGSGTLNGDYRNTPIGMVLVETLVNDAKEEVRIPSYYSLFDAVPMIESGELSVDGIETGTLACPDSATMFDIKSLVDDYNQHTLEFQKNPFWCSKELKNLRLDFNTGKSDVEQNLMVIFNDALKDPDVGASLSTNSIESIEDLNSKMMSGKILSPTMALNVNIASTMFDTINQVRDCSGTTVLGDWKSALADWKGLSSFFKKTKGIEAGQGTDASKPMSAFGGVQSDSVSGEQGPLTVRSVTEGGTTAPAPAPAPVPTGQTAPAGEWSSPLIHAIRNNAAVRPISDLEGNVIGGYSKETVVHKNGKKVNKFILVDKNTLDEIPEEKKNFAPVCIIRMLPVFIQDLKLLAMGRSDMPICFISTDTIQYYRTVLDGICKKLTEE